MQRRLSNSENNIAPDGASSQLVTTPDGLRLRVAVFRASQVGKGTVCLLQGRAEFIEKYFETIDDLLARGFSVITFDWRGQGGSERMLNSQKGHVDRFDDYHTDLMTVVDDVMLPDCPPPYYVLAHSMGGLILLRSLMAGLRTFDRAFFTSPLLQWSLTPSVRFVGAIAGALNALGLGTAGAGSSRYARGQTHAFAGNLLTTDPDRLARNQAILVQNRWLATTVPTFGWVHAASQAMQDVRQDDVIEQLRLPVLMATGSRDQLVDANFTEKYCHRVRAGGHISIVGARHELLQERDRLREQLFAAFDAFIPGTQQQI